MALEHDIAYMTAKIDIESPNSSKSVGTGFFYRAPLNDGSDKSLILLISNKHVFTAPKSRLIISLNRMKVGSKRTSGSAPAFGKIIKIDQIGFEDAYYSHPDDEVDLACVNVSEIAHSDAFFLCLFDDFLSPIDYDKLVVGSDVIFVGYPRGFYDVANNLPLVRKGSIASIPHINFNGKGQIVVDAQIFRGSSGSPVFVQWNRKYALLGVVSAAVFFDSKLQILPANEPRVGVEQILGLGIVIKQNHVRELIDHAVKEFIRRNSPGSN